jgi:hypothetical protein
VLAAHAYNVAAPLRRVKQKCEGKARLAADRMMGLEGRDLVFSPGMVTV